MALEHKGLKLRSTQFAEILSPSREIDAAGEAEDDGVVLLELCMLLRYTVLALLGGGQRASTSVSDLVTINILTPIAREGNKYISIAKKGNINPPSKEI